MLLYLRRRSVGFSGGSLVILVAIELTGQIFRTGGPCNNETTRYDWHNTTTFHA